MHAGTQTSRPVPDKGGNDQLWGILRDIRSHLEFKLFHRQKKDLRYDYVIGRSKTCDIVIQDKHVSSHHCSIYCDYTQAAVRVFVEDSSSNGTFLNGPATRLSQKQRAELKSGDEIYILNPDLPGPLPDCAGPFLFIDMRGRYAMQKKIMQVSESEVLTERKTIGRHVNEIKYIPPRPRPRARARARLALTALPLDIYFCIQEFTSINALLNTSKRLDSVKHRLFYWKLTKFASFKFCFPRRPRKQLYDPAIDFSAIVMGLMHDSRKQLSLNLFKSDVSWDSSALGIPTLKLIHPNKGTYESDVSTLGQVHSLNLSYCSDISDVSTLGHVHTLNLRGCRNISDVSALGHVHTLNLRGCHNISDVSALGHVHTLNLRGCRNISDVSALGHVHTLNLRGCRNISDVSALGHVHTLNLSECRNISDVSALGHVHTLNLRGCRNISDVSALGHVHTLNLSECRNISDVSALGHVHTLDLSRCGYISDVSALGHVHTLNLSSCSNVTKVSALRHVHTLDLSYCFNLSNVNALGHVRTLYSFGFSRVGHSDLDHGVSDASALGHVHTLNLTGCDNVLDFNALGHIHTLYLDPSVDVSEFPALRHVHIVNSYPYEEVSDASDISDAEILSDGEYS
jgi:hypothetical protein